MATGPVDLFVDTDTLRELGREIESLISALDGAACRSASDPTAMGGEDVAGAVDRFLRRWDDGRNDALTTLRGCLLYVNNAIEGYDTTESILVRPDMLGPRTETGQGRRP